VRNPDGALRGGMFAKGRIVLDRGQPAAVIPATAVREESGQPYVFTIEGGRIARRPIKVGATQELEGLVEVVSGLEKGMSVVAARVSGLKAGAPAKLKS
jgi:multidrug efflux pump subunit AcrA (membrane-fusion protein)